ncbi:MAG TPA: membrane protein insertase YidC, partial [Bacteroidales bacterium]|nr:membrane protein insertase YidC [Bacteroidales bacterium]
MGNSNTIIGLLLIFGIFIGYSYLTTPSKSELQEKRRVSDSIALINNQQRNAAISAIAREQAFREAAIKKKISTGNPADSVTAVRTALRDKMGSFAGSTAGKNEYYTIENDLMKIRVASEGGKIAYVELKNYKTWDMQPLVLVDKDSLVFGLSFFSSNRMISTNKLFFKPFYKGNETVDPGKVLTISGKDSLQFAMRLYVDAGDTAFNKGKYIEYLYTIHGNEYMLGYQVNFSGMTDVIDPGTKFIGFTWNSNLRRLEKSLSMERMNSTIYYKFQADKVDYLTETKDEEKSLRNEKLQWISFKQQFFSSTIIAKRFFSEPKIRTATHAGGSNYMRTMYAEMGLPYSADQTQSIPMSLYYGPNGFKTLKSYHMDLERQIPLGWGFFVLAWINIYAVIPVFNFLGQFGWNYGIIILILTILIKIFLFPIAYKTYKSSAKMRALKPDIDELTAKYPKKEDAMKKQQATMDLYKRAGVNPMAGCIPLLLQMPILIAMFRFFPSSIELRQKAFLWATDLSSYDSIWTFPGGFKIPWYGDHVSLFALLMTISSVFYTRINDQMM